MTLPIARRALTIAILATLLMSGLPFVVAARASFLGKDVTTLAAGLIGFYPGVAAAEVARVIGSGLISCWAAAFVTLMARRHVIGAPRLIVSMAMPVAYLSWLAAALFTYPAIFSEFTPSWLATAIYRLAFVVNPSILYVCAALLALLPLVVWIMGGRLARLAAVTTAVVLGASYAAVKVNADRAMAGGLAMRPNILLIGIDSLRRDRLDRREVTPALQALMADPQAVSFEDHYVGIPRTFPSWIELLTGRYAPETGIRHMFPGFGARAQPFDGLVTRAKADGYETAVISDFAGDIFPRFEAGFATVDAPHLAHATMIRLSIDQALPAFLPLTAAGWAAPLFPALRESPAFADPARLRRKTAAQIERVGASPWLVTAFFSTAHFPYAAPHPYYTSFTQPGYSGTALFQKNPDLKFPEGGPPAADVDQIRGLYDGAVLSIDDQLAELFGWLRASGRWDSTLIVVTADHGEDLFEHGLLQGHGEHLRGVNVLRVPLIMKLPTSLRPALSKVEYTSRVIDIAPTLAGLLNIGAGAALGKGHDWSGLVTGAAPGDPQLTAYAETGIWFAADGSGFFQKRRLHYPGIAGLLNFDQGYSGEIVLNPLFEPIVVTAKHRMLISGDDKLIYQPTPRGIVYELYDRRRDPDNEVDLAAAEPARLGALKLKFFEFIAAHERQGRAVADFIVPR